MDGSANNSSSVLCHYVDERHADVICDGIDFHRELHLKPTQLLFWGYVAIYVCLVLFAGVISGLTMGLLSLDSLSLEVLRRGGKKHEQKYAGRILGLVKQHHLLLVSLLLANSAAVEAMPVFLNQITSEVVAILVSITAVLLFGEIIPQALCTRYGLAVGYYCAPLVWLLMAAFYPIAFPIAVFLDRTLGKEHGTFFRRAELRELVKIHATHNTENEEPLTYDEVLVVKSALEMRDKTVKDAMTPLQSVYMLDVDGVIDTKTMDELLHLGHSRVPIYEDSKSNVVGLLLVKRLIKLDPLRLTPVRSVLVTHNSPPSCMDSMPLYNLLNEFQTGRSHLYLVYQEGPVEGEPELVGIITLEDVIEELIGEEIVDETDVYVDVHKRIAVARARVVFHKQSVSAPAGGDLMSTKRFKRSLSMPQTYRPSIKRSGKASRGGAAVVTAARSRSPMEEAESIQIDQRTPLFSIPEFDDDDRAISSSVPASAPAKPNYGSFD